MNSYETIEFKEKYKSLDNTLFWLVQQALISVPYCREKFGSNNSIQKIWTIGKFNLNYTKDTPGVEQIQSVPTLLENNIHGKPGSGDCDCFTVFTISMLLASNYNPKDIFIVLQGRKKNLAVHVLTAIKESNGKYYYIDFTEKHPGVKRKYNFIQFVPIKKYL